MKTAFQLVCILVLLGARGTALAQPSAAQASAVASDEAGPLQLAGATQGTASRDAGDSKRVRSLAVANTIYGPSGLLRTITPDSGETGTFRLSVVGSFFSSRGFLCPACSTEEGDVSDSEDSAAVFSQSFALSLTPLEFFEGTAALSYRQAENTQGDPEVVQTSGNATLGARAFLPPAPDLPMGFGGGVLVDLLKRPNGIGVGATNASLHLEGSLDLSHLSPSDSSQDGVPVRFAANVAYEFDNSAAMIESLEADREADAGSPQRISRVERFGWDVDRVDSLRLGLGMEGILGFLRPFAEWSIDLPANRQGYTCLHDTLSADDQCLAQASFADIPSRLTLGVRGYPWFDASLEGVSLLGALDVATGGSSSFLEEVAPEPPWNLYLGLGYAFDSQPRVKTVHVERVRSVTVWGAPDRIVKGQLLDTASLQPIAEASVVFQNGNRPGMLTDAGGGFETAALEPGNYTFRVRKQGYLDGQCSVTVAPTSDTASGSSPPDPLVTSVRCLLEALPARGDVEGALRDAQTQEYVAGANVSITDPRGKSLSVTTDERGAFRFENVPEGTSRLEFQAAGYVASSAEVVVRRQAASFVQVFVQPK